MRRIRVGATRGRSGSRSRSSSSTAGPADRAGQPATALRAVVTTILLALLLAAAPSAPALHPDAPSAPAFQADEDPEDGDSRAWGEERAPADHVVLISIDGLMPSFYRDPDRPAPMLQRMARDGVSADAVRSVFPSVTYPSHTTMITGALPARHGILHNEPFDPEGQTGAWYWHEEAILVPTLWDAVREAGGSTASVSWPVSVGAPVDWNVPEYWSLEGESLIDTVRGVDTPDDLVEEIEAEATGRLRDANFALGQLRREDRVGAAAAHLLTRYRPTLLTVHLIGFDHFMHEEGRDGETVPLAVAAVDRAIAGIVEALRTHGMAERTAIVVTGDHGFVDIHTELAPNLWLAEAGLQGTERDRGDWRATFHTSAASAFLRLRDPEDRDAVGRVREILESRPAKVRGLFRVLDRERLDARGADPNAPLALSPAPGVSFTDSAEGPALRATSGGTHGYWPDLPEVHTGLVAWGAGVREGVIVPRMGLEDVAPLVAALLGLDFDAPDGNLFPGLLQGRSEDQ